MLQRKTVSTSTEVSQGAQAGAAAKQTRSASEPAPASTGDLAVGGGSGQVARMEDWHAGSLMSAMGLEASQESVAAEAMKGGSSKALDDAAAAPVAGGAASGESSAAAGPAMAGGAETMAVPGARVPVTVKLTETSVSADGAKEEDAKPTEAPSFDGAAGENTCQPKTSAAKLDWSVRETPTTWGVNVTAFTVTGQINVAAWPSKPTDLVTPNTANPVDGGNITDAAGNNNWKFAIKEMEEYNQSGGGRSSYWHSYEASKAHEWAHWNTDYMKLSIGVYWPQANKDLDAITIPKADAADAAAARTKLQAQVDTRLSKLRSDVVAAWNAIPDSPGAAGGAGYKAGQAVLDGLIAKVRAYATSKGWK